jgi:hypothetical protein
VVARVWMVAAAGTVALIAGCGGDGGGEKSSARPSSPPKGSEPLAAAAGRLQRALPGGCKALAPLMLHSVPRGLEPGAPPRKADCRYIKYEVDAVLRGFKPTKTRDFGAAGLTEGTGDQARKGNVIGVVWARDRDGSWKVVYDAVFRPQIGFRPAYPAVDTNARAFVTAIATRSCNAIWTLLNVGSRFVRNSDGRRAKFCKVIAPFYRDRGNAFAQIRADREAVPRQLGSSRDISFYGLELKNGRYFVLVLAGRLGGIADAEQKQHLNPSVLEFLTVRPARG